MAVHIKFWGVRGSIACASPSHVIYGGNTSCVEIQLEGLHVIFDAGTGLQILGKDFLRRGLTESHLFLTHTHWDHICGFPFFSPLYHPECKLSVYAGHLGHLGGVRQLLATQMAMPVFPVPLNALKAKVKFVDFVAGETLSLKNDVVIRTAPLCHPDGATAYRVEQKGISICYVTDTEHDPSRPDQAILDLIAGADLVIYDCTYTEAEFSSRQGWGHSTWEEGMRLCQAAGARRLAVFHHDPDHDDDFMAAVERDAHRAWEGIIVARDNMELTISCERQLSRSSSVSEDKSEPRRAG